VPVRDERIQNMVSNRRFKSFDSGDSALAPKGVVRIQAGRRQCQLSALSARHSVAFALAETPIRILRILHDLSAPLP